MVVLKSDYSSCPLKKRPLSVPYNATGSEQTEPEDLSVKFGGDTHSASNTRTHDSCVQEPHIRTHDPCVHGSPASLLRTREPQSQAIPTEKPQIPPVYCRDSERLRLRVPQIYGEATLSHVHARELHFPDAHGVCPQTHTDASRTQDTRVQDSTETERESMYEEGQTRTPDAKPMDSQTPDGIHPRNHIPGLKHQESQTPVPESRISFTINTSSTCTSPDSTLREATRAGHTLSTCETRRLLPPVVATPRPQPATPKVHMATPRPHKATLVNFSLVNDISNSGINNDRVSPSTEHVPSLQTAASWLRLSEMRVPGEVQSSNPTPTTQPHRPWLADDPPRQSSRLHTENVPLQPARPRPLLPNSSLWAGMVPIAWPMPHFLPPAHPPSPGRHHRECHPLSPSRHSRECGSPGSESVSSDSSSGAVRGEARYSCAECSKSYSTYSGLSKHKQFHCAALGAKSFACKHCDKVYTSLGALKMHIRTHTLPCKCQLCGKAFSRPWLLQGHIRTHTGEKPFQCPQCDRCFADRSNLRAHLQTHADVKKYACVTCHKTFSRMSLLNKHTEAACPALHRRMQP